MKGVRVILSVRFMASLASQLTRMMNVATIMSRSLLGSNMLGVVGRKKSGTRKTKAKRVIFCIWLMNFTTGFIFTK